MPRGGHIEPADEPWASAIAAGVAALIAALCLVVFLGITSVDAASPHDRCLACRQATPRPEPSVVGIPPRPTPTAVGIPTPALTIPPSDTE